VLLLILCGTAALPLGAQWAHLAVSLDSLKVAAARDSLDPVAQYQLGIGYWTDQKYALADSALRRAVRIEPRTAAAYLALSYLNYVRRPKLWEEAERKKPSPAARAEIEESDRYYRRAFMIDPLVDLQVVGLIVPRLVAITDNRVARSFFDGIQGFFGGQYERAFDGFEVVVNAYDPKVREKKIPSGLLLYHGLAAAHIERYDVAVKDFRLLLQRAIEEEKTDSINHFTDLRSNELRYMLAGIEQAAGQRDSALARFQQVLTVDLGQYMAHVRMAEIYEFRHQWDEALEERHRAAESNPEDPSLQYELGLTLALAHRYPESRDVLVEAVRANPLNARIPYVLGKVQALLHEPAEARATLTRFIAIAPSRFQDQVAEARQLLASLP